MELHQALREIRMRSGLTQQVVADRAHRLPNKVSAIERGETTPSWKTLQRHLIACDSDFLELAFRLRGRGGRLPARYVIEDDDELISTVLRPTPRGVALMQGRKTLLWGRNETEVFDKIPDGMRVYRMIK